MKHLQTFEEFVNESAETGLSYVYEPTNNEHISESVGYILKDDPGQGRPTMVLKLEPSAWEKVKHLFGNEGRPDSDEIKRIPAAGAVWTLYASEYVQDGKVMHKIYGASGDYTFGNAPSFYQQKYRGNKKAAKAVFNIFINKFLKE